MAANPNSPGLDVQLSVDLSTLGPGLAAGEREMETAGRRMSQAMDRGLDADRMVDRITKKIGGAAFKFALIGLADSIGRGLADAIKTAKSWDDVGQAIGDRVLVGMKHIPLIGAFAEIGEAIAERLGSGREVEENFARQYGYTIGRGHNVDPNATDAVKRFRKMQEDLQLEMLSPAQRSRAILEREVDAQTNPQAREEGQLALEAFDQKERFAEYQRQKKRDAELVRTGILDRRSESQDLYLESLESEGAMLRKRLGWVQDAIPDELRGSDLINSAQTAIGTFRMGQADAGQMVAENTKKIADLNAEANRLLKEIERNQEELDALR